MINPELIYDEWCGEEPCGNCGCYNRQLIITPYSVHWGRVECYQDSCRKVFKNVSDPEKKKKRPPVKHLKDEINYCEICLRGKEQLGFKCVLVEHHILPYKIYPELDMVKENRLKVCTHCHQFIENLRKMLRTGAYKDA